MGPALCPGAAARPEAGCYGAEGCRSRTMIW